MENSFEEKNPLESAEGKVSDAPEVTEAQPADAAPEVDTPAEEVQAAPADGTTPDTDGEAAPEKPQDTPIGGNTPPMMPPPPMPNWRFGAPDPAKEQERKERKKGMIGFFAVFGSVMLCCILLLFLTLWLGNAGFNITETVNYERTVYVREDGTVVGTYTPGEVVDLLSPSTVTVIVKGSTVSGFGSGFIYSAEGYIITNHHVIATGGDVQVMLHNGKVYDATVVGSNEAADVAVVKINADEALTPVKIGNSNTVLVGENVAAIGTPVELDYQGTATFGRVSATSRIVTFSDSDGNITKRMYVLQTDTSVNPGNSGGPLVNMDGEVIGVVVMKLMGNSQEYYEGLGFALPINGVTVIADEIIEKGSFTGTNPIAKGRLLLGITGHTVIKDYWYKHNDDGTYDTSMSRQEGFMQSPESGVYVVSAQAGSGAAGLVQEGDIIIKADGMRVLSINDLIGTVNRRESGYGVTLTVLRNGAEQTVVINLSEEPLQ